MVDIAGPWIPVFIDADHGTGTYRVADGQLFVTGEHPRMYVYDPEKQRQWRDVEITVYFMRVADARWCVATQGRYQRVRS